MSTSTATMEPDIADPIDALVPPSRPKSVRLLIAVVIVVAVGMFGYLWQFGVIRPAPDCCGSSSRSVMIGQSGQEDAVTIVATFYNSSPRSIDVQGATADLPAATVIDIAPFTTAGSVEFPPISTGQFPVAVAAHQELSMALTFAPDRCDGFTVPNGWGEVQLDLAVGGDPGYPTLGRTFKFALLDSLASELTVLQPARLDGFNFDTTNPLSVACVLLGR